MTTPEGKDFLKTNLGELVSSPLDSVSEQNKIPSSVLFQSRIGALQSYWNMMASNPTEGFQEEAKMLAGIMNRLYEYISSEENTEVDEFFRDYLLTRPDLTNFDLISNLKILRDPSYLQIALQHFSSESQKKVREILGFE